MENTGSVVSRFLSGHNCTRHLEEVGNSRVVGKGGARGRDMELGRAKPCHPHPNSSQQIGYCHLIT